MGSLRRFFRKNKQQDKQLYTKISLSVASIAAALGFFCPLHEVIAQNIERSDNGTTVKADASGFRQDIYAGTIDGKNAINKFKHFELDENHIANMYFHMKSVPNKEATNLLNFVDDSVKINGTVNAIQNNKIGGNLFFLFKDGLVVGKTGVINAGSFSAMPIRNDIGNDLADMERANEYMNLDSSLLDLSGTIDIYGQINTINGIRLKAGRAVNIGGVQNNELVKAALRTGLIDFSNVVNIKDADGKVKTASGLSGSQLQATRGKDGEVVLGTMTTGGVELIAEATHANAYDSSFTPMATGVTGNNVVRTEINIGEGSTVQAYGDISLKATSTNGAGQEGLLYGDINADSLNVTSLFGQVAKTEAFINVGDSAKLQAGFDIANNKYNNEKDNKGSVSAVASTQNFYIDGALKTPVNFASQLIGSKILEKILGESKNKISGSFVNLENESSVNIGKNSVLEAAGNVSLAASNVIMSVAGAGTEVNNLKANAAAAAEQQASNTDNGGNSAKLTGIKDDIADLQKKINDFMPGAAFAYNATSSKATINIDEGAQLTSKAGNVALTTKIDGTNITSAAVKDGTKKPGEGEAPATNLGIKLGLAISDLNDKATINVKKNAKLTAEKGAVAITSAVEDRMKLVAAAVNSNPKLDTSHTVAGEASTALGLSFVNNSSNVNIEGEISAARGISVSSETKTSLTMSVNNAATYTQLPDGTDTTSAGEATLNQNDAEKMVGEVAKAVEKTVDKAVDGAAANVGNGAETKKNAKALIALGASVGAVDSDLQSNVNISKTAKLKTTGGALSISSASKYDSSVGDLNLVVSGKTINVKKKGVEPTEGTLTAVNASMLLGLLKNDAKINIEDGSSAEHAELSAPVIKLSSDTATHWDRVNGTVENITNEWNKVKKNLVTLLGEDSAIYALEDALEAMFRDPSDENVETFIIAQDELMEKLNASTVTSAIVLAKKNVSDVLGAAKAFMNVTNYVNFAVGSSVGDKVQAAAPGTDASHETRGTDIGISGSLLVTDLQNTAQINVGKYASVKATQGNLELNAKNDSLTISTVGAIAAYNLGNLWTKAESLQPVKKVENIWKKVPEKVRGYISGSWGKWEAGFIPQFNVSGSEYGIGGNINISNDKNTVGIFVGKGAELAAGKQLNLTAEGQDVNAALVFGGAKTSKTGITGMGSYIYGGNDISVSVDDETRLTADELALRARNEEYINSLVFGFTSASEQAVGAALNIVDFHSRASATVEDNDDEDDKLEGVITANGITVSAENTGVNNAAAIAGSSVDASAAPADKHDKQGQIEAKDKEKLSGLDISSAGSLAMVLGETETKAAIAGKTAEQLKIKGNGSKNLSLTAEDSKYNGAYSGSGALQFLQLGKEKEQKALEGSLSGAVAAVDNQNTLNAYLANAVVDNYGVVESRVLKEGVAVAAGVALGVQSVKQKDLSGQLIVSGSGVGTKNDIYTELSNVKITNAGLVKNIAQNKDVQVAGGLTVSAAKNSKVGLGGAISVLNADNNLLARIHGGNISAGSIENLAVAKTTQVSGALTVGVLTGLGTAVNANGALSVNVLNNDVQAVVEGSNLTADYFAVRAYDGNLQERSTDGTTKTDTQGNSYLDDDSEDAFAPSLKSQGLNVDGQQALANINNEVTNVKVDKDKLDTASMGHDDKGNMTITSSGNNSNPYVEGESFATDGTGSLIISTAVAVSVDAGSEQSYANLGAANVDNVINNNFAAKLTGSSINKNSTKSGQEVSVDAASRTQVIGVAMGVEAGQKSTVGAGGSVTVQSLSNKTTATVENTTGIADKLNITAQNSGLLVNVAGAGAGAAGQTVAAGLTVVTNVLHNTTGAYARGVDFSGNGSNGLRAAITADNTSEDYGFAVGVQAVTNNAVMLNGATAINKGTDNVEAVVDSYEENGSKKDNKFSNVGSLDVKATDKTVKTAVAGGVQVAVSTGKTNYAALGGAVAYNEIGDFTEDSKLALDKQHLLAQLKNAEITMKQGAANKAVNVAADSDATLVTIAGGLGVSVGGLVNGQGAAATALTNTQTEALMQDSSISDAEQRTAVSVSARSESDIVTSADALNVTVPTGAASVGLSTAVAVNRITSGNSAQILNTANEKKQLRAGSLNVNAYNEQEIINAGLAGSVGVAAAGSNVGVGANVSVNKITTDNTASISGMDIAAGQAALVKAQDKRSVRNYTGSFMINGGATAGVGGSASVAVNEIGGATLAQLLDSNVQAKGLTVAADSENQLQSVVFNAGVAGSGVASVELNGNVNVNSIGGSTKALMKNTDYNANTNDLSALEVSATDKADVLGIVGNLNITASPTAAVGLGAASDTALLSRETTAQLVGNSNKNKINAAEVNVKANGRQNVDSWAVGFGVAVGIAGAGGLNGAVGVVENTAATQADMENITGTVDAVNVSAEHESDISRYALASSIVGGAYGAAAGVSVGVLHDDSKTVANLNNNSLWGSAAHKQKVSLLAQNKTLLNSFIGTLALDIAIGAAAGGDGSNESYTNYVAANARNNTFGSADNVGAEFNAAAKNIIDNGGTDSDSIGSQMGLVTVAPGTGAVGVILNKVDTATYTNIEKNTIYAKKIDIQAQEDRKIKNAIYNNGLSLIGAGVSVILTDINTKAEGFTYDAGNGQTADVDVDKIVNNLQSSLDEQADYLDAVEASDALQLAGISTSNITGKSSINAESKIEGKAPAGVHTVVKDSKLYAGDSINVSADATTNLEAYNEQVYASGIAVNVAVSKTNMNQQVGTSISDSELVGLTAAKPAITLASTIGGKIVNSALQGGTYGALAATAYTGSWAINENILDVTNSTLSGGRLSLLAKDSLENEVRTDGASAGGFAGGALIATAISAGENKLNLTEAKLTAAGDNGDISLIAERSNKVNAEAWGGALAAGSASGVVATAVDGDDNGERQSSSTLNITDSTIVADKSINAVAQKLLDVKALTRALNVGAWNANGSQNKAVATGKALLNSSGSNSFTAGESIKLASRVDKRDGADYGLASDMESDNGSAVGLQISFSDVLYDTAAETQAAQAAYNAKKLSLLAENNPDIYNRAKNVEVGALVATGTIEAGTQVKANATVNAKGLTDESKLSDAEIKSSTNTKETIYVSGNGGGLLDISPVAAKSLNRLTTNATTNILGSWSLADMKAAAVNEDDLKGDVYSLKVGGLVGYGGVKNYNVVKHEANLNIGDGNSETKITTTGSQLYNAANILKHNFKSDADAGGVIYVSLGTVGTIYDGEGSSFAAKIKMNKAQLTAAKPQGQSSAGTIQAQAYTQGSLKYENSITNGGFYTDVVNDSYHKFTYDNAITTENTTLTTEGQKDITLAAWDDTDINLDTYANSNGAIASAFAHTTLDLERNNNIDLKAGTNILSNHDVQLYAGRDLLGNASQLDLTAMAEAYNHSFIAAGTSPQVYINTFKQNNQVNLAGGSLVQSVHDVYMDAVGGTMNLTKSAKRYTIWRGNTTSEPTPEEKATAEAKENKVTVDGAVIAGLHNGLNLNITGNAKFDETYEDGKLSGVTIDAKEVTIATGENQDWFDKTTVAKDGLVRFDNPLLARYNELYNSMTGYAPESAEYNSLKQELSAIVQDMKSLGFVKVHPEKTDQLIVLPYIEMPAINLPDIYVSGGNIYVTSDDDKIWGSGNGSLTAKGVRDLSITNSSNMNLVVNDIVVEDPGGKVQFNNANIDHNFNGHVYADSSDYKDPKITISSTGTVGHEGTNDDKYSDTNIVVVGKVKNVSGAVEISNSHSDINISGDALISASSITIKADAGSVTQTSDGLVSVGSDPIARYQFSDTIAKKIQQYIANLIIHGQLSDFVADDYDAYCNYLVTHQVAIGLDQADVELINRHREEYKRVLAGTTDDGRGIVAGNNIYVTARNINIDGLMQSGYALYKAEFTEAMAQKMQELDNKYSSSTLLDSEVLGNDLYLLNKGGAVYNAETKRYDNEIRLYYNPATKTILSDSVETSGGQIYLNGAISSTGAGRILAMNGAADVSIDLSSATAENERKLQLSQININKVDGVIGIMDTNNNYTVDGKTHQIYLEYLVNSDGKIAMHKYDINEKGEREWEGAQLGKEYKPVQGTYLSWTGGVTGSQTIVTKSYEKDFIAWGLIKFNTTDELVKAIEREGDTSKVVSTTTTKGEGDTLANGTYFGRSDDSIRDFSVTGENFPTGNTVRGETKTELDYTSYLLGFGKAKYTWTETTPNSTSSTTTILADKAIGVGFMQDSKGNISIKNAGDIKLSGALRNASVTDSNKKTTGIGSIELVSSGGAIQGAQAGVYTDQLLAQAQDNIGLTQTSIGDTAQVSLNSTKGDIVFNSLKGNLVFTGDAGENGAAGAQNGGYLIKAAGNVMTTKVTTTGAGEGYADKLVGKRLLINADKGSVDVRVKTGQDLGSGEYRRDGLSITAQGDIKVYHDENGENLLLGKLTSATGDVSVTTTGSLVDAIDNNELSDAESKLERWQQMGLVSSADNADSKANAAQAAKNRATENAEAALWRLAAQKKNPNSSSEGGQTSSSENSKASSSEGGQASSSENSKASSYNEKTVGELSTAVDAYKEAAAGLANYIKAYEDAMLAAETEAERQAATSEFAEKQQQYFAGKNYTAEEQQAITNYAHAASSDGYGWSANQLLYAIKQDVLMSEPGQTVVSAAANITGKDIALKAGKGIGLDAEAVTIAKADMSKLENMQILANAKAGDLTWNSDGSVTVRRQQPILLDVQNEGKVSLSGKDNIYLATINNSKLNLKGEVRTNGDLRLMSANGITADEKLYGRNITLYGGAGSIGAANQLLKIGGITGALEANTARVDSNGAKVGVYLQSEDSDHALTLQGITTGELVLKAAGNMAWTDEEGKNTGYLDAQSITLEADGSIGNVLQGIRLLNNEAEVSATAGNIYLDAVNKTAGEQGSLTLKNITVNSSPDHQETFGINSAGTIKEAADAKITAYNLSAKAAGDILLNQGTNKISNANLSSAGNIDLLTNTLTDKQRVDITVDKYGDKLAQSIKLVNAAVEGSGGNLMTIRGLKAQGDIKVVQENAANVDMSPIGLVVYGDVESATGDIWLDSNKGLAVYGPTGEDDTSTTSIKTNEGNIALIARGADLVTKANISAGNGYVALMSNGSIVDLGNQVNAKTIAYVAKGNINFGEDSISLDASKSVGMISLDGDINIHKNINLTSEENVLLHAKNNITVGEQGTGEKGSINAKGKVNLVAETGSIHNVQGITAVEELTLKAEKGSITNEGVLHGKSVELQAANSITNNYDISVNGDIIMKAGTGLLNTGALTTDAGNIKLDSDLTLNNTKALKATQGNVSLTAGFDLVNEGAVEATAGDAVLTTDNKLQNSGSVKAGENVRLSAADDLTNSGAVEAAGNILLDAGADLTNNGSLQAGQNITLTAAGALKNLSPENYIYANRDISFSAKSIENSIMIKKANKVTMSAEKSLVNSKSIGMYDSSANPSGYYTVNEVLLTANTIENRDGGPISANNNVELRAQGVLKNNSHLNSYAGDILLTSALDSVEAGSQLSAKNGRINIQADQNIKLTARVMGGTELNLTATKGDVEITPADDHFKSIEAGVISVKAGKDITNNASLTANTGALSLNAGSAINNNSKLQAKKGDILLNAGGNISNVSDSTKADEGEVSFTAGGAIDNQSKIEAGKNVSLKAEADISNAATITAAQDISLRAGAALTNTKDLTATNGKATLTAGGNLNNTGTITAKGNIALTSTGGSVNNGSDTSAAKLQSESGDVLLTAANALTNSGEVSAEKGSINIGSINGAVSNSGKLNAEKVNLTVRNANKKLTNSGAITATAGNAELLAEGELENTAEITAAQNIILRAGKALTNTKALTATNGKATLTAGADLNNTGAINAKGNIALTSTAGSVTNGSDANAANLTSTSGDVLLTAMDELTNKGEVSAAGKVSLNAVNKVDNKKLITARNGDITLRSVNGAVLNNSKLTAANGGITLRSTNGAVTNSGEAVAGKGNVDIGTVNGDVTNSGEVSAVKGNINISSINGAVSNSNSGKLNAERVNLTVRNANKKLTNSGAITATAGKAELLAEGELENTAEITAAQNIILRAGKALTNTKALTATNGKATLTAGGALNNTGAINAKGNIALTSTGGSVNNGSDANAAKLQSESGDVLLTAMDALTNNGTLQAAGKVSLNAVNKVASTGALTTDYGDVNMSAAKGKITHSGDITANNGSIKQTAGGELENTAGQFNAGSNIELTANEIANAAGFKTGGNAKLKAEAKLTNTGAIEAAGFITLNGSTLKNSGKLTGKKAIALTAGADLENTGVINGANVVFIAGTTLNNAGQLTSGNNLLLQAQGDLTNSAALTAEDGLVKLISTNGSINSQNTDASVDTSITADSITISAATNVTSKGDLTAKGGSVDVKAEKGALELAGKVNAKYDVTAIANDDITHKGGFINAKQGDVLLQSKAGGINNEGSIVGQQVTLDAWENIEGSKLGTKDENTENKYVLVAKDANGTLLVRSRNGDITVNADGIFAATGKLVLEAKQNISNNGQSLNAGSDLILKATEGAITNKGILRAGNDVELNAYGDVTNSAEIEAKGSAKLISSNGSVTNIPSAETSITAKDITITAANDITSKGNLHANDGAIYVRAANGALTLDGRLTAQNEVADNVDVINKANIIAIAKGDVTHTGGFINAKQGDVLLQSEAGGIDNSGSILGQQITLDAWKDIEGSKLGNADDNTDRKYVLVTKDADGTLLVRSRNGGITINDDGIFAAAGDLRLEANNAIQQNANLFADKNIYIANNNDDITLGGRLSAINGSVTVIGAQDIKADNLERLIKAELDVILDAKRDVSVGIVEAGKQAKLRAAEGNLSAEKITGEDVFLSTNNADKSIKVKRTYVADTLGIKGNNAYLYDEISADSPYGIWQTGNGDVLELKLDTAAERPWENLVLNFHQVNKSLHIDELWVKDLLLRVPADELYIDRLQTLGTADIATNKMHSLVYGRPPLRADVDSIYWNAPNTWMHLYFYGDGITQHSDGALLHLRDYRYVYNQRFTAENWLLYRTLTDDALYRGDIGLIPLWERYNLLDYTEAEPEAEADVQLKVE